MVLKLYNFKEMKFDSIDLICKCQGNKRRNRITACIGTLYPLWHMLQNFTCRGYVAEKKLYKNNVIIWFYSMSSKLKGGHGEFWH
jgi:hypothetical protein